MNQGYKIGNTYISDEFTVRISWLLPATIAPLAMVIHLLNGNSRDFPFFISEADYPGVERWVFTIGLALSGLFQMIFAYRMCLHVYAGRLVLLAQADRRIERRRDLVVIPFSEAATHFCVLT